ncbi:P-loop containing nucleoside triphosphate hydrolase protein [Phycomyces blakesleeanus]|uniref:Kinesin-like protein n=1 Tax=Phycomyces blakesleeanus TaxID=4837 RepID=A0ABR3AWZ4_PHYBL
MAKDGQGQIAAVQVALRIRTLSEKDRAQPRFANLANGDCLRALEKSVHVVPLNKLFTFDHVFGPESRQSEIFAAVGQKLIHKFVEGYNVTILAYGQTSSGKTYTMGTAQHSGRFDLEQEGIVPRAMSLLFDLLQQNDTRPTSPSSVNSNDPPGKPGGRLRPVSRLSSPASVSAPARYRFSVKVSFVEIYNEDLIDLLNSAPPSERPPVNIREDTKGHIYWTGVKEVTVSNTEDVLYHLQQGTLNRATGSTDMNEQSSRSHAIFSVTLRQERWVSHGGGGQISRAASPVPSKLHGKQRPMSAMNGRAEDGEWIVTNSKFNFVDLAGSERLKRTAAEGDRRKEGININGGLLALGNVISALGDPSKRSTHVPYRDSKLTRLLQDSLGGSATTLMIACASPAESNLAETLNTLQYANRARNIKNKVEKNEAEEWMTTDNIELLRSMVGKLRNNLARSQPINISNGSKSEPDSPMSLNSSHNHNHHMLDVDQSTQDQQSLIADLQRQVEEMDFELSVTREKNRVAEDELRRLRTSTDMWKKEIELKQSRELDFQHLVEPVIEEYEKSISALESQLAMAQAAINHSDYGFHEQLAKQEQCEIVIESQEQTIMDLRLRLSKVLENEHSNDAYIEELEEKLRHSTRDAVRDQEHLNELRSRVMKLKEVDESTENYIASLEQRGAATDAERALLAAKVEELEGRLLMAMTGNLSLSDASTSLSLSTTTGGGGGITGSGSVVLGSASETDSDMTMVVGDEPQQQKESEVTAAAVVAAAAALEEESMFQAERIRQLSQAYNELQEDHQETTKELDEVLVRYQEALEQIELLQSRPQSNSADDHILVKPL